VRQLFACVRCVFTGRRISATTLCAMGDPSLRLKNADARDDAIGHEFKLRRYHFPISCCRRGMVRFRRGGLR